MNERRVHQQKFRFKQDTGQIFSFRYHRQMDLYYRLAKHGLLRIATKKLPELQNISSSAAWQTI